MRELNGMGLDKKLPFLSYFPLFLVFSVESSLDDSKFPYRVWEYSANMKDFAWYSLV